MSTEFENPKLYKCSNCLCELTGDKFYNCNSYPKSRDYHSNYCKICYQNKTQEYKDRIYTNSKTGKINLTLSHELLSRIGYDVSDLENNSIHEQFMTKYGYILNRPIKVITDEEKKEQRRIYYKKWQMLNRD